MQTFVLFDAASSFAVADDRKNTDNVLCLVIVPVIHKLTEQKLQLLFSLNLIHSNLVTARL